MAPERCVVNTEVVRVQTKWCLTSRTEVVLASGMHLRDYLSTHPITPGELAKQLGVTREAVRKYAAGERFPRPRIMDKLIAATKGKVTYSAMSHGLKS